MTQDGFSFEIDYLPLKRVWRGMAEDSLACTFPSSSSAVALGTNMDISNFIQSKTIDHVSYRVVVRPGEAIVTDPTKLIGKRVAVWNGMPNAKLLGQENIELEETNSEETRVKMLFNDRVDAMIGFVPDLHIVAEQLGYPQPESAGSLVVWGGRNGTHLVCHDTPENRALIEQFDNVLTKVKTSGRLREILGPYADINE
jgi:ABC-type amino acid transport substrate-binding protein